MKVPKEARKISRELFNASFVDGQLDHGRVSIIAKHVGDSKPRHYIDILQSYERLLRLEISKHHALVESASELDAATREQLESTLRAKYGQDLTTEFKTAPELIGGLRIKIGSDVFDSSVRDRLDRLKSQTLNA
jgi:F-type H+-transporting ATPase subunit delta